MWKGHDGHRTRIGIRETDLGRRFPALSSHRATAISGLGRARPRAKSVSIRRARSGRLCAREIDLPALPASNPEARNARSIAARLTVAVTSAKAVRSVEPDHPVPDHPARGHLVQGHRAVTAREDGRRARPSGRSENVPRITVLQKTSGLRGAGWYPARRLVTAAVRTSRY